MSLPLTELLLGLDLATMVVFGMLLRRKKGLRAAFLYKENHRQCRWL